MIRSALGEHRENGRVEAKINMGEEGGGGLDQHYIHNFFGRKETNVEKRSLSATVANCLTMQGLGS